jgi:hypothetical protein
MDHVIGGNVFRPQLQATFPAFPGCRQAIYRETQIGQYILVDDVIEKHGIRVESFFRQDHAVIKGFGVLANGSIPIGRYETLYLWTRKIAVSRLTIARIKPFLIDLSEGYKL